MMDAAEFGQKMVGLMRDEARKLIEPLAAENARLAADNAALHAKLAEITAAIAAIPAGKDGQHGSDGAPGRDGADGVAGPQGIAGKNGAPGIDGKSVTLDDIAPLIELSVTKAALEYERRAADTLQRAIERIPVPKDGAPGRDGADGLGFDDLAVEFDGERAVTLKFTRGDVVKSFEFELPAVIDRGVFQDSVPYAKCDGVTFGGSWWIARKDLPEGRPGTSPDWRLAVKKGRDGKDGRDGIDKAAPVKLETPA